MHFMDIFADVTLDLVSISPFFPPDRFRFSSIVLDPP